MPIATVMSRHASRVRVATVAVLWAATAAATHPAAALARQEDPAGSTTTTTTVEPTPSSSTTTTTRPPSTSTTTTTAPPGDPGAGGDVTGGVVPDVDVTVPPHDGGDGGPHVPSVAIVGDVSSARERLALAEVAAGEAERRVTDLQDRLSDIDARLVALTDEQRQAVKRVEESQNVLAERAVDAYIRGNTGALEATLTADDPNEASHNDALLESVLVADNQAVDDFRAARRQVSRELVDLADERARVHRDLAQAKHADKAARDEVRDARVQLLAFEAGSEIFVTGMHFPVGDPHDFSDTWHAPRSGGRQHQGVDIFAPSGTDLFAVERGVITGMGTNSLGGIKLWLYGESGTTYYYAHLLAFAPGLRDGAVVDAGTVVGFVGNTGNAISTPSHLHFEIHPGNGPAVNPTPLLQVVDALDGGPGSSVARR